jgi:LPS O-antigen subunit length determinant protein (WzzB/FepE family)
VNYNLEKDEIDLKEFFSILWQAKFLIISTTFIASILVVLYALSIPNIYKSEAKLAPVSGNVSLSNISGQMGGLATLAGIDIPSSSNQDKSSIAFEVLKSRKFFEEFLESNDILIPLMASNGWDKNSNKLLINKNVYDVENNKWLFDKDNPKKTQPTSQEAFITFSSLFSVNKDKLTGFFSIEMEHYSPHVAKEWLDIIIIQINDSMRLQDIASAERSVEYLKAELNTSSLKGVQNNIYNLIETQIEKKVLAQATPEYVFQVIDPPIAPEKKVSPRRAVICIIGALIGGIIGVFIALIRQYFYKN